MKLRSSVYGWKSVWMDLADEMNGEFIDGTVQVTAKLPVVDRPWTITLEMHANPIGQVISETTVISLPYAAAQNFKFAIHNTSALEEVAKVLGLQDITVGDEVFDKAFIIQGNEPRMVQQLFADASLKTLIQEQKSVNLSVIDSHNKQHGITPPVGINVITFVEKGAINSFERLNSLIQLMTAVADRLVTMEIAASRAPHSVV